ncbi:hypothetical protein BC829DRAFT_399948, partial [Chytridium lagenaria]
IIQTAGKDNNANSYTYGIFKTKTLLHAAASAWHSRLRVKDSSGNYVMANDFLHEQGKALEQHKKSRRRRPKSKQLAVSSLTAEPARITPTPQSATSVGSKSQGKLNVTAPPAPSTDNDKKRSRPVVQPVNSPLPVDKNNILTFEQNGADFIVCKAHHLETCHSCCVAFIEINQEKEAEAKSKISKTQQNPVGRTGYCVATPGTELEQPLVHRAVGCRVAMPQPLYDTDSEVDFEAEVEPVVHRLGYCVEVKPDSVGLTPQTPAPVARTGFARSNPAQHTEELLSMMDDGEVDMDVLSTHLELCDYGIGFNYSDSDDGKTPESFDDCDDDDDGHTRKIKRNGVIVFVCSQHLQQFCHVCGIDFTDCNEEMTYESEMKRQCKPDGTQLGKGLLDAGTVINLRSDARNLESVICGAGMDEEIYGELMRYPIDQLHNDFVVCVEYDVATFLSMK